MRIVACLLILCSVASAQTTRSTSKKLIEFGWDEPDTAFMRKHIAKMERMPFDGCVFTLTSDFLGQGWGNRAFAAAELQKAIDDLTATTFKTFTHNFLRFDVTPGDVDWFDDFAGIVSNAKLAATIAKKGKAAGILFDIEQYAAPLWNYAKQRDAKSKSFDQYAEQAKRRGREVMTAFQQGYPDLTVFLTFGYTLPLVQGAKDKSKLAGVEYGLLAPFLDGMLEVARGKAKIVDGFEISYAWKQMSEFDDGLKMMREGVLPIVADADKYRAHMSAGFGVWMDQDWRKNGWDVNDATKNYFTPQQFQASVKKALATADEYVWIYTEKPKWWAPPNGESELLPQPYVEAVRAAKEGK